MRAAAATAATALALFVAGCSVDTRSGAFRCTDTTDCSGDRVCESGWCVSSSLADAGDVGTDADSCPAVCDDCANGICTVNCNSPGACSGDIDCPDGLPCEIHCFGDGSCSGDIACPPGDEDCTIRCRGLGSCSGDITSGDGDTEIRCPGADSCNGAIDCSDACECGLSCGGVNTCQDSVVCPSGCDDGDGCSDSGSCNQC